LRERGRKEEGTLDTTEKRWKEILVKEGKEIEI
jgi:hypothetical protein